MIAGLDACFTAFRILYVSTVFVDAEYRRKGIGTKLIREMEKKAAALGADTIRLDTFNWQGKEFSKRWKLRSNLPARHLYEKAGFVYRGKQRWYAENTGWEEFLLYEKKLT